jgi:hypothetical protein
MTACSSSLSLPRDELLGTSRGASRVLVLQQPMGGDLPANATSFCFLVSKGPEGGELQAKPDHIYETCDAAERRWLHVSGDQFARWEFSRWSPSHLLTLRSRQPCGWPTLLGSPAWYSPTICPTSRALKWDSRR